MDLDYYSQISRDLAKHASFVREELSSMLKKAFEEYGGSITLDCWTDDHKKMSYLGITAHFIKENANGNELELHDRVICTRALDPTISKDNVYIKSEILKILHEFKIFNQKSNIVFVTDRGRNIVLALKEEERLNCMAHLFNNVVSQVLKLEDVMEILDPLKKLVK